MTAEDNQLNGGLILFGGTLLSMLTALYAPQAGIFTAVCIELTAIYCAYLAVRA